MSAFPRSPRLLKGALIGMDPANPLASVIVFQYNPERMTRRLDARTTRGGTGGDAAGARAEPFRLTGAPRETITLNVEIDAADQLEKADPLATASGISPTLSALEMLLYPKSAVVVANTVLAELGFTEIIPPQAPLTVFVWGPQRVLPVRLSGFTITEEAYDTALNPLLAKVDLTLDVLSYSDLKRSDPGYTLFLAHQIAKEISATANVTRAAQNLAPFLKNV
ncbi:hypothetical protein GCM10009837_42980 [Streptomyces durmitorensis]|uniref:Uncharacterized protein n=1 Tax=Streptomyces durmitorensis TaxID=319947 RepID=A0ABY4Q4V8_9ACTN|nr:hypothetical protein [Streptomyces durmitorensis]UQT60689.1 hypothetical protein M4V62_39575 [Streptomyces durmitorensis]